MFDLGEGATEQWERGEKLLDERKEREKPGKKSICFLIVCEKCVLGFKQCAT